MRVLMIKHGETEEYVEVTVPLPIEYRQPLPHSPALAYGFASNSTNPDVNLMSVQFDCRIFRLCYLHNDGLSVPVYRELKGGQLARTPMEVEYERMREQLLSSGRLPIGGGGPWPPAEPGQIGSWPWPDGLDTMSTAAVKSSEALPSSRLLVKDETHSSPEPPPTVLPARKARRMFVLKKPA